MHIYLMGYRGSGKTTVGRNLADRLQRTCLDTDALIVDKAEKSIAEIFKSVGESGFRDIEEAVIDDVASFEPQSSSVVSLGGGAVLRESNRLRLAESGRVVWLPGPPETHYARIHGDAESSAQRPALTDNDGYTEVVEVMRAREPIYRSLAQKTVNTDNKTPDDIVEEILLWVKSLV